MTEIENLEYLLYLERAAHSKTRRKLAKAEHDRDRYAKRIRFENLRREQLSREFRALMNERDILVRCVEILEGMVINGEPRAAKKG